MKLLTIDFETYYDKEYSLSKMTTEEYIRDSRFEAIGVSVQEGELSSVWFSGTHAQIKKFLAQYDWQNAAALAHNAMFDMAILNWHFGIKPKKVADTLSMARALHTIEVGGSLAALAEYYGLGAKGTEVGDALGKRRLDFTAEELARYGEYCKNDVALTHKLFGRLAQGFPVSELNLIDLTIRMFSEPVIELDAGVLELNLNNVREAKRVALTKAMIDKDQLMSNDQLAELLRNLGVQPPTKISPTTGKQAYAFAKTDEAFLELLEHDNLHVQALAAARLGVKSTIEESRTERLLSIASRGLMPIPLRYYAAHTGRWGGDDKVNMQNLPRNSVLKYALRAPTGYKFIDCDSSQIEARTLAWWAGQDDLVAAFERGDDVYKIMASAIYGKPVEEIDKSERFVGKTTILGSGYGMGPNKFQVQLQNFKVVTPLEECQRIIAVYRQTYDRIPELWKQAGEALVAMMNDQTAPLGRDGVVVVEGKKGIRLPNGLYLRYPNLRWHNDATTGKKEMVYDTKKGKSVIPNRIYGGKVVENCCQAIARIIIGEQLIRVSRKYRVALTVHDAIGVVVPDAQETEGLEFVEQCMRTRPVWAPDLPLNCEGGSGESYGDC